MIPPKTPKLSSRDLRRALQHHEVFLRKQSECNQIFLARLNDLTARVNTLEADQRKRLWPFSLWGPSA